MISQAAWSKVVDNERRMAAAEGNRITVAEAERRLRARGLTAETMRPARAAQTDNVTQRNKNLQVLLEGLRSGLLDRAKLGMGNNSKEGLMLRSTGMTEAAVLKELGLRSTAATTTGAAGGKERRIVMSPENASDA